MQQRRAFAARTRSCRSVKSRDPVHSSIGIGEARTALLTLAEDAPAMWALFLAGLTEVGVSVRGSHFERRFATMFASSKRALIGSANIPNAMNGPERARANTQA